MSANDSQIVCRKCNETVDLESGACPQCGTSIRGNIPYIAGIALGVLLIAVSAMNLGDLLAFGVFGLLIAAGSGFFLYEKRQRIKRASQ